MRILLFRRALFLPALLLLPGATLAEPEREAWFRITNLGRETIGWQHETRRSGPDGEIELLERQLAYRVDGHLPIRQYLRREVRRGSQGAILSRTIYAGRSVETARPARPDATLEVSPMFAILEAAEGKSAQSELRITGRDGRATTVLRLDKGRFDAAWEVMRSDAGAVESVVQPLLGGAMAYAPSSRPLSDADLTPGAIMRHPMVPSPYDITLAARDGHIRYRFGLPPGLGFALPETGEQRLSQSEDASVLDLCAGCGPGLPASAAELARWSAPSPWIESTAPELRRAVTIATRKDETGVVRMARLGRIARSRLARVDYEGHYSARNAWKRARGDCTEDAVLLAALARAAGIPARVASGLVYDRERYHGTRNAFLPHAWTLAYVDGAWRSFDISVGDYDSTHIALAVGDGEPETITAGWRLAALLEWRGMAEVRSARPQR